MSDVLRRILSRLNTGQFTYASKRISTNINCSAIVARLVSTTSLLASNARP
jgi:hypothetical protein